jgi:hypothetical protein
VPVVPVAVVLLLVGSVFDVGFVDAVVFRLPLVFSLVVLGLELVVELLVSVLLEGEVLYIPALELLELGAADED